MAEKNHSRINFLKNTHICHIKGIHPRRHLCITFRWVRTAGVTIYCPPYHLCTVHAHACMYVCMGEHYNSTCTCTYVRGIHTTKVALSIVRTRTRMYETMFMRPACTPLNVHFEKQSASRPSYSNNSFVMFSMT